MIDIDIESRVTDSLHARADRPTDRRIAVDRLRAGAVNRARTLRRRQRVLRAAAGTGLAAAVVASGVLAPRLVQFGGSGGPDQQAGRTTNSSGSGRAGPGAPAEPATPRVPGTTGPTTLPEFPDAASAGDQPAVVGTDPGLLHFDVTLGALDAVSSEWVAAPGFEAALVTTRSAAEGARPGIEIYLGSAPARLEEGREPPGHYAVDDAGTRFPMYLEGPQEPTTVNGRPATLQKVMVDGGSPPDRPKLRISSSDARGGFTWVLRWQPIDGLYAMVQVRGDADQSVAFAAANAMRLDRTQRCAVPLRLTAVAAGTTVTQCRTAVRREPVAGKGVWLKSQLLLQQPGIGRVDLHAEASFRRVDHDLKQFKPNHTVAGHPAMWLKDPLGLWILDFGPAEVFVAEASEAEAVKVTGGLTFTGDLARPETWPQRVVG